MEIAFPIEFVVRGTPRSLATGNRRGYRAWQEFVRDASRTALPEGHFATFASIAVTLFYFPVGAMQGDIDNIVKPILDALTRHIYMDDRQVERIWVQKFETSSAFGVDNPSPSLAEAVAGPRPTLYVRLSTDIGEGLRGGE